jgi:DNA polymerase-3 subunit alpha
MAAILTSEMGNSDKMVGYFAECRDLGIKVLPPDLNESQKDFTVVEGGIRFGLAAIKNVGEGAVESVIVIRNSEGPFRSFLDFCRRIDLHKVNKRVLEGLIKVGTFDSTRAHRSQLMAILDKALDEAAGVQREREQGQMSIFAEADSAGTTNGAATDYGLPELAEWDQATMLKHERELTGFYITAHPLARYADAISRHSTATSAALAEVTDGKEVKICGIITTVRSMMTKKGDRMAYFHLEDLQGVVEVIAFPDLFRNADALIVPESIVQVTGIVDRQDKGTKIKGTRIASVTDLVTKAVSMVSIRITESRNGIACLDRLEQIFKRHPGSTSLSMTFSLPSDLEAQTGPLPNLLILASEQFVAEVEEVLGKGSVCLQ